MIFLCGHKVFDRLHFHVFAPNMHKASTVWCLLLTAWCALFRGIQKQRVKTVPKSCQPGYKPNFHVGTKKTNKPRLSVSPAKAFAGSPKRHRFLQATSRQLIQRLRPADKPGQPVGIALSTLSLAPQDAKATALVSVLPSTKIRGAA